MGWETFADAAQPSDPVHHRLCSSSSFFLRPPRSYHSSSFGRSGGGARDLVVCCLFLPNDRLTFFFTLAVSETSATQPRSPPHLSRG